MNTGVDLGKPELLGVDVLAPAPIGAEAVHDLVRIHALALLADVLGFPLQPVSNALPQPDLVRLEDETDEIQTPRLNREHLPVRLDLQLVIRFQLGEAGFPHVVTLLCGVGQKHNVIAVSEITVRLQFLRHPPVETCQIDVAEILAGIVTDGDASGAVDDVVHKPERVGAFDLAPDLLLQDGVIHVRIILGDVELQCVLWRLAADVLLNPAPCVMRAPAGDRLKRVTDEALAPDRTNHLKQGVLHDAVGVIRQLVKRPHLPAVVLVKDLVRACGERLLGQHFLDFADVELLVGVHHLDFPVMRFALSRRAMRCEYVVVVDDLAPEIAVPFHLVRPAKLFAFATKLLWQRVSPRGEDASP